MKKPRITCAPIFIAWIGAAVTVTFLTFSIQNALKIEAFSFQDPPDFLVSNPLFHHTRGDTSDPVTLPYADETFDAVFSMGVLEHVEQFGGSEPRSVMELERVLKKNGLFFIFHLPNLYTWIEFVVRQLNRNKGVARHEHTHLFTRSSFYRLLEGTSFEIRESGRYNFLPRNSFSRLGHLASQEGACRVMNAVDTGLTAVCPVLCQNWYFILRKISKNIKGPSPRIRILLSFIILDACALTLTFETAFNATFPRGAL
jgi:SAM-dependent methyltransferase